MPDNADSMQPSEANGNSTGAAFMNLSAIIARIEETIDMETASIRTDPRFDIKTSNARKSRYLYELNKAISALCGAVPGEEHRAGVLRLRDKLASNEAAILAHLNAVTEVASLIQSAIENAEADGTYSADAFGREARLA